MIATDIPGNRHPALEQCGGAVAGLMCFITKFRGLNFVIFVFGAPGLFSYLFPSP